MSNAKEILNQKLQQSREKMVALKNKEQSQQVTTTMIQNSNQSNLKQPQINNQTDKQNILTAQQEDTSKMHQKEQIQNNQTPQQPLNTQQVKLPEKPEINIEQLSINIEKQIETSIAQKTADELNFCQQLIDRQLQSSQMLLTQKVQYSSILQTSKQLLTENNFKPVANLRPRSAEIGRVVFSYISQTQDNKLHKSSSRQFNSSAEISTTSNMSSNNEMDFEERVIKHKIKHKQSDVTEKQFQKLLSNQNVQQLLYQNIQQDTHLANKLIKQFDTSQLNNVNSQINLKLSIINQKQNITIYRKNNQLLNIIYLKEIDTYVIFENQMCNNCIIRQYKLNKQQLENTQTYDVPFSVKLIQQIQKNSNSLFLSSTSGQVFLYNLNDSNLRLLFEMEAEPILLVNFNNFIQNIGQIDCLLIFCKNGHIIFFDLLTRQLIQNRSVRKYSDSINTGIFNYFTLGVANDQFAVIAAPNGLVSVFDIQLLVQSFKIGSTYEFVSQNQSLIYYQVISQIEHIFLDNNYVYVAGNNGELKIYQLQAGYEELPLICEYFNLVTENTFEKPITALINKNNAVYLITQETKIYHYNQNKFDCVCDVIQQLQQQNQIVINNFETFLIINNILLYQDKECYQIWE